MIDIELMWEVLQAQLRSVAISYALNEKRKHNDSETKLKGDIKTLEKDLVNK